MRIKRRIKRTTKQYFIVVVICIIVIGGAAIATSFIFMEQMRMEYKSLLLIANSKLENNSREVYVATSDILAGEYITTENSEKKIVYDSQPSELYFTDIELGMVALVDISTGTHLIKNMLADNKVSKELRELEYDVIHISSNIANHDTVDVRIFYPNGESYVVLSKKVIRGYLPESVYCCLWLEEAELLRTSAAIVDAAIYSGARLYMTKYIEPSIQEASIITYTPSLAILSLLESDPNILERSSQELNKEVRKALENRLADNMGKDVSTIQWQVNQNLVNSKSLDTEDTASEKEDTHIPTNNDSNWSDEANDEYEKYELGEGIDYFLFAEEVTVGGE